MKLCASAAEADGGSREHVRAAQRRGDAFTQHLVVLEAGEVRQEPVRAPREQPECAEGSHHVLWPCDKKHHRTQKLSSRCPGGQMPEVLAGPCSLQKLPRRVLPRPPPAPRGSWCSWACGCPTPAPPLRAVPVPPARMTFIGFRARILRPGRVLARYTHEDPISK